MNATASCLQNKSVKMQIKKAKISLQKARVLMPLSSKSTRDESLQTIYIRPTQEKINRECFSGLGGLCPKRSLFLDSHVCLTLPSKMFCAGILRWLHRGAGVNTLLLDFHIFIKCSLCCHGFNDP